MKYFITILSLILINIFACTKSSDTNQPENNASIIGKWKQTEFLLDPGDGSGTWMPETNDYFIQFNSDSTYENSGITTGDIIRFSLPTDSTITFIYPNATSTIRYEIQGTKLTLTGGCIEPCGSKYIKQN